MSDHVLSGGKALSAKLAEIARSMGGGSVSVGFMEGPPVAAVAFWNEYGAAGTPPRPFFRRMIAAESPGWAAKLAGAARATNLDGESALGMVGADISDALKQSINNFTSPALVQRTVEAKGFDKPLIDTAVMINSITYKVSK